MKPVDEIKLDRRVELVDNTAYGGWGYIKLPTSKKPVKIIFSSGMGWDHVSASRPNRCLTWEEMCAVKDAFFYPQECAIEYHPPESDTINFHPYVLHLWRPQNQAIPMPPKCMV